MQGSTAFISSPNGFWVPRSATRQQKGSPSKPRDSKLSPWTTVRANLSPQSDAGEAYPSENHVQQARDYFDKTWHLVLVPTKSKRGECDCIWCQGTKMRKCSWCAGKGYRFEYIEKSWEELSTDLERMQSGEKLEPMKEMPKVKVECSACSGTKQLRCGYCRGSGVGSYGHAY